MSDLEAKKDQERTRKADWRAKQRAISEGTYSATPIEQAKRLLEQMKDPDIAALYEDEELGLKLKQEDKRPLQNFVYQLKLKRQKEAEEEKKKSEEDRLISEKGRAFINEKTYQLHQALLMSMSEDERKRLIKETIDTNIFLFLEYMEGYQLPSNDFLEIVVGLQSQLDA